MIYFMMMSKNDITNREILEALNVFSTHVDSELHSIRADMSLMKSQMVTKDYLDRKLWDLQGDMVSMTRREIERHEARFHAA